MAPKLTTTLGPAGVAGRVGRGLISAGDIEGWGARRVESRRCEVSGAAGPFGPSTGFNKANEFSKACIRLAS